MHFKSQIGVFDYKTAERERGLKEVASIIFRDGLQISRNVSWSVGVFWWRETWGSLKHRDKQIDEAERN